MAQKNKLYFVRGCDIPDIADCENGPIGVKFYQYPKGVIEEKAGGKVDALPEGVTDTAVSLIALVLKYIDIAYTASAVLRLEPRHRRAG